jgi:hypothetical protein
MKKPEWANLVTPSLTTSSRSNRTFSSNNTVVIALVTTVLTPVKHLIRLITCNVAGTKYCSENLYIQSTKTNI